jgi:hypothetical protein
MGRSARPCKGAVSKKDPNYSTPTLFAIHNLKIDYLKATDLENELAEFFAQLLAA